MMERFLEKHWPAILALMLALGGCGDSPEMRSFDKEYDWSKPSRKTADLGIQVTFPSWLAAGDQDKVLATVESYAKAIVQKYPSAAGFWWGNLRVYLHEAVSEKIVSYCPAIWCWGWQLGKRVYTPWRPLFDAEGKVVGVNPEDTFMVIPHEVFHLIRAWELGLPTVGNDGFTAEMNEAIAFARGHALGLELSQESVRGALAKLPYVPWIEPGK